jgi:methylase of polypeptide subunit release factors
MEVGMAQAEKVAHIFLQRGWQLIGVYKDLAEIERVVAVAPPLLGDGI